MIGNWSGNNDSEQLRNHLERLKARREKNVDKSLRLWICKTCGKEFMTRYEDNAQYCPMCRSNNVFMRVVMRREEI